MPHALTVWAWTLPLTVLVALSAACGPKPRYSPEQLAASPEGQLRYPGATYEGPLTSNESSVFNTSNSIHLGLGTDDSAASVGLWYHQQLAPAGWQRGPSGGSFYEWSKDEREFVVECGRPVNPTSPLARFATFCNVGLDARPPSTPTPASSSVSTP